MKTPFVKPFHESDSLLLGVEEKEVLSKHPYFENMSFSLYWFKWMNSRLFACQLAQIHPLSIDPNNSANDCLQRVFEGESKRISSQQIPQFPHIFLLVQKRSLVFRVENERGYEFYIFVKINLWIWFGRNVQTNDFVIKILDKSFLNQSGRFIEHMLLFVFLKVLLNKFLFSLLQSKLS